MKSRLTKTARASYAPTAWTGKNASGAWPVNDLLLILPDTASDKMGDKGLILKTQGAQADEQLAAETGVIVAIGEGCFQWSRDRMRPYVGRKPEVGDRVFFQRYAGQLMIGDDGVEYRYMADKELGLVQYATAGAADKAKAGSGTITT